MSTSNLVVDTERPFLGWLTGEQKKKAYRKQKRLIQRQSSTPVTVGKLHANLQTFPNWSLLLGQSKDGLPFLLDFSDPAAGPILISGDEGCGKTHQLQVLVESAVRLFRPSELQISILTHTPPDWDYLVENTKYRKYLQEVHAWYVGSVEEKIQALTELAERRRDNDQSGPVVMLIMDDLNFIEELSFEAQVNLRWLMGYGAQSNVWVIAAVKSKYAKSLSYWLEPFRTRILGKIQSRKNAQVLASKKDPQVGGISHSQFSVWSGTNWLTYQLPLLGR